MNNPDPAAMRPIFRIVADIVDSLQRTEAGLAAAVAKVQQQGKSPRSWWQRWFKPESQVSLEPIEAAIKGLAMSARRADEALMKLGMEPIVTVGQLFDPEQMEVVEAVVDSGAVPGTVVGEVQRGYRYSGQVIRFAKVRTAK